MLAREVLRLRGTIYNRETPWDVMVDLYFCMSRPAGCCGRRNQANLSQTATLRPRPRRRSRRRSSPPPTRLALPPSRLALSPPVRTGRLPLPVPLASGARTPLPPAGTPLLPLPLLPPSGVLSLLRRLASGRTLAQPSRHRSEPIGRLARALSSMIGITR